MQIKSNPVKLPFIYTLLLACGFYCGGAFAQQATFAFYNTENLADTVPNPTADDADFTPTGRFRWDTEKYRTKIANIARVIDDLDADIIGLCEVENEEVLRDLMYAAKSSYNYIHRDTRDMRGMDAALLYKGGTFFPTKVWQAGGRGVPREFLVVEGELHGVRVTVVVCHMPSMGNSTSYRNNAAKRLGEFKNELIAADPESVIVLMGDFNASPDSYIAKRLIGISPATQSGGFPPHHFATPFTEPVKKGYGTYVYRDKRMVYDFIAVSPNALDGGGLRFTSDYGIFAREYLFQSKGIRAGYPLRSFESSRYTGGYSDHLPVFLTLTLSSGE